MFKFSVLLSFLAVSFITSEAVATAATELIPADLSELTSGRHMLVLDVIPGKSVKGQAPEEKDGVYCISDGSVILWGGKAGDPFDITPYSRKLYLMSIGSSDQNWQAVTWHPADVKYPEGGIQHVWNEQNAWHFAGNLIPNSQGDSGPALRAILRSAAAQSLGGATNTIDIPKGEYHFYPAGALPLSYYVSNHDQQDFQSVGIPIVAQKKLTINGNGSTFIFHGAMQPILVMDSEDVQINDITIQHDHPYYNEGKIVDISDGCTTLQYAPQFRWMVKDGIYYLMGDGTARKAGVVLAFRENGQMVPTGNNGDIVWTHSCEQIAPDKVRFHQDASAAGLQVGDILVQRHYGRPHPAMVLYRADSTVLNEVVFRDSQGMALVAQRCRDITINGGGCICAPGRVYTVSADATHFSNCAGTIEVRNALYEGMMDDAINVHSTCLRIVRIENDREIVARYMHPQAIGFETFQPGEKVQFINAPILQNHPTLGVVKKVSKLNERELRITLSEPLPAEVKEGDAIENADWYPAVNFIGCTVRYNRARGSLFTTPAPVLVKDCKFIASHGSAILLAGDAQGWFESGRCLDVKIVNNLFDHNLTARYQFTEAVISIYPMVQEPQKQTKRYHRNILIEGNTFRTHRVPLIYAISADELIFRNNTIIYDDMYPGMHGGTPYILRHCGRVELQPL